MERANRSDVHLSKDEETKIEEETRQHFDELAPKRHSKPQRSEYSSKYTDSFALNQDDHHHVIPEYIEFQHLEHDSQKLVYNGDKATEEFIETEYYKDLNGVDKQHHTTGTGFIKMDDTNEKTYNLQPGCTTFHSASQGNPATNDWIPSSDNNNGDFVSDKPMRSES